MTFDDYVFKTSYTTSYTKYSHYIYVNTFFKKYYLFIYWPCLVFVAASGGYSSLQCAGFSLQWLLLLRSMGSRRVGFSSCGTWALLERRLSSCGARAYLLRGMWDLPGPGLEPVSPALAGRFSTTAPPGKLLCKYFLMKT